MALAWLLLLATISAWLALTLSTTGLESILALVVTLCRRSWGETITHGAELGRLSLLLPLILGLFLAWVEARRLTQAASNNQGFRAACRLSQCEKRGQSPASDFCHARA